MVASAYAAQDFGASEQLETSSNSRNRSTASLLTRPATMYNASQNHIVVN